MHGSLTAEPRFAPTAYRDAQQRSAAGDAGRPCFRRTKLLRIGACLDLAHPE